MEQNEPAHPQAGEGCGPLTTPSLGVSEALTPVLCTWEPRSHEHPAPPSISPVVLRKGTKGHKFRVKSSH